MDESASAKLNLTREDLDIIPFIEFKRDKSFCDVILKVQDKEIPAHKIILAATIPYFEVMFQYCFQESSQEVIVMQEIEANALECLIELSYGGEIEINFENADKILCGADFLHLNVVKKAVEDFLIDNLSLEKVLSIKRLGEKFTCVRLITSTQDFIDENFLDFANIEDFLESESHELISFIDRDELRASEEVVFEAVMKWIKYAPNRMSLLPEILPHVRICLIPQNYLFDVVLREPLLQNSSECKNLLEVAVGYHKMVDKNVLANTRQNRPRNFSLSLIYIIGGESYEVVHIPEIQVYDPIENQWRFEENIHYANSKYQAASAVYDRKMYMFGGLTMDDDYSSEVEIFDAKKKTFSQGKDFELETHSMTATVLDESIFVLGGWSGESLDFAKIYSPRLNEWTDIAPLNQERSGAAAVSLNGQIYVIGGGHECQCLDSCERYDPKSNTWSFIEPLLVPRWDFGCVVADGKIYVCGGTSDIGDPTKTTEVYDPELDEWNLFTPMNVKRSMFCLAFCHNKLYAIGGFDKSTHTHLTSVEAYDFESNSWNEVAPLLKPTAAMCCGVISK